MATTKKVTSKASPPPGKPEAPCIFPAMGRIMAGLQPIAKESKNKDQGWFFRGIDAVYNAMHDLLAEHGVFTVPEVIELVQRYDKPTRSGGTMTYTILKIRYHFYSSEDGSSVVATVLGEGADTGDKSANKSMAVGHKYAILQCFLIPLESGGMVDPDYDTPYNDAYPQQDAYPELPPQGGYLSNPQPPQGPQGGYPPPPQPPVQQQYVPPQPVPPTPPPPAPPAPDENRVQIEDADGAKFAADSLINLVSMHGGSKKDLNDFWKKNRQVIDKLDSEYPDQYERIKQEFTKYRNQLEGNQ